MVIILGLKKILTLAQPNPTPPQKKKKRKRKQKTLVITDIMQGIVWFTGMKWNEIKNFIPMFGLTKKIMKNVF